MDKKICNVELLNSPTAIHFSIEMHAGDDTVSLEINVNDLE
ncbi:hypothetical protein [Blautia wexlerae]|nr:hypothetical protein [Blautia wexlerae]